MSQRFLILCRYPNQESTHLGSVLSGLGEVELISDTPSDDAVWHPDETMLGYERLAAMSPDGPAITAWERAWMQLNLTHGERPAPVWLIEDDVAGCREDFSRLLKITNEVDADLSTLDFRTKDTFPQWPHWHFASDHFAHPACSFNPLCRLSSRLVAMVLEFRRCHRRFIFQETLFASLVADHGLSYYDWREDPEIGILFNSFRYRPEIDGLEKGIHHPVKNSVLHGLICRG